MPTHVAPATALLCIVDILGWFGAKPATAQTPNFYDLFDGPTLDASKWSIDYRTANGTIPGHKGFFTPDNLDFSTGMLRLRVTQEKVGGEIVSKGASIQSKDKFGYGTYTFVMRMASTSPTPDGKGAVVSGSVSAGYTFVNNSETELDIEFLGDRPTMIHLTNWNNRVPTQKVMGGYNEFNKIRQYEKPNVRGLADGFHTYVIDWEPGFVRWYINGKLVADHRAHVPKSPAFIKINLWGSNNPGWGGFATLGTTRYMYVRSVTFKSLGAIENECSH